MKTIALLITTIALFSIVPAQNLLVSCRLPSDPPPKEPAGTSL